MDLTGKVVVVVPKVTSDKLHRQLNIKRDLNPNAKKAMKLAQKQAFAKHRSNITNTKFGSKKTSFSNKLNKIKGKNKKS